MNTPARRVVGGLEGVVVGQTRLSRVDGQAGRLTLAGFAVETLAPAVSFESALFLLWHDRLPTPSEHDRVRAELAEARRLPAEVLQVVRAAAKRGAPAMNALRLGVAALGLTAPSDVRLVGAMAAMLATYVRHPNEVVEVPPEVDHATALLWMLHGRRPTDTEARALTTYLVTVCDHGMNASTFAARVVASTGSDDAAAIEAALGALAGPLHGGAPGPALEALLALRDRAPTTLEAATVAWVEEQVAQGERIMGFGHRVYRVRDPRADVLAAAAKALLADSSLLADAQVHERAVLATLSRLKPDRPIATNVEYYTALLLHGLGIASDLFTAVFAVGRVAGWTAHIAEQRATGRLIRPRVEYIGPFDRSVAAATR
ncbi:MAG: citrate/2-methylcitrate synthase [Myxococcota bacterium]